MADVVQYRLERMVDELDDLERRGIFTRAEIAEIVKQRRKFEYRLKRPSPLKEDFIAYIDYEVQLDGLRQLRRKAVARESKKKKKKSISDFAGVARIVEIYRLATMRYKGDINLWFRYLEFCKQKRHGRMKKALAQVIRFHPKVAGVWIYAAAWEFDRNLNVAAARALMQNGLRVCSNSEDLWVEYLRMELTYLNKLKARRVALGEDKGSLVRDKKTVEDEQWKDENKELFMSLDEKEGNEKEENDDSTVEDAEDVADKVDVFREKGSNVLQAIYSGAVEALPSSFDLRKRFLEILEATDLAHSDEIRNTILSDLKRDFSKDPEYWNWLARHEMGGKETGLEFASPQVQKAIQAFEEGVQTVTSSSMFEIYIKFLMEAIAWSNGDDDDISPSSSPSEDCISHIINVYQKADETGCLTEELADEYVSLYLKLGRTNEAQKLAEKLCSGKFAGSAKLWLTRVSIDIRSLSGNSTPSNADLQSVFELLSNALREVPISESESLWLMAFEFFAHQRTYFDKLVEMSILSVAKGHGSGHLFSLASTVVKFVLQTKGSQSARKIYKRFLALPGPSLVLYKDCIEIETNLALLGDKDCLKNARKLYDSAVASYSQDVELWKDYYSLETKMGTSETANGVYWRARKTLKESAEDFIVGSDLL